MSPKRIREIQGSLQLLALVRAVVAAGDWTARQKPGPGDRHLIEVDGATMIAWDCCFMDGNQFEADNPPVRCLRGHLSPRSHWKCPVCADRAARIPEEAEPAAPSGGHFDVVCDGPPGPTPGRFVEVEDERPHSTRVGEWIERDDGYWVLRVQREHPAPSRGDDDPLVPMGDGMEIRRSVLKDAFDRHARSVAPSRGDAEPDDEPTFVREWVRPDVDTETKLTRYTRSILRDYIDRLRSEVDALKAQPSTDEACPVCSGTGVIEQGPIDGRCQNCHGSGCVKAQPPTENRQTTIDRGDAEEYRWLQENLPEDWDGDEAPATIILAGIRNLIAERDELKAQPPGDGLRANLASVLAGADQEGFETVSVDALRVLLDVPAPSVGDGMREQLGEVADQIEDAGDWESEPDLREFLRGKADRVRALAAAQPDGEPFGDSEQLGATQPTTDETARLVEQGRSFETLIAGLLHTTWEHAPGGDKGHLILDPDALAIWEEAMSGKPATAQPEAGSRKYPGASPHCVKCGRVVEVDQTYLQWQLGCPACLPGPAQPEAPDGEVEA